MPALFGGELSLKRITQPSGGNEVKAAFSLRVAMEKEAIAKMKTLLAENKPAS